MSWLLSPSAETSSHSSNSVSMPLSFLLQGLLLCDTPLPVARSTQAVSQHESQVTALRLELRCTLCGASR